MKKTVDLAPGTPPWAEPGRFRANNFDAMRFVFAITVILSHAWPLTGHGYDGEPGAELLNVSLGEIGLATFFVISGFLVTASWERSSRASDYFRRRLLRIYPGFLVAFGVSVLVFAPLSGMSAAEIFAPRTAAREGVRAILLEPPYLPGTFPGNPYGDLNGSMWTIKYEFGCYLLVALLGGIGLARRRLALPAAFLAVLGLAAIVKLSGWAPAGHRFFWVVGRPEKWPWFLGFFLAGATFYRFRARIPCRGDLALVAGAAAFLAARWDPTRAVVLPPALAYVILWAAFTPRIRVHGFARRGDFSYGIYLYAYPVQQLLVRHVPAAGDPWVNFALATPVALLCGVLSWRFVERPMIRRKPGSIRRPAPAPTDPGAAPAVAPAAARERTEPATGD